jgi:hypothetical protein
MGKAEASLETQLVGIRTARNQPAINPIVDQLVGKMPAGSAAEILVIRFKKLYPNINDTDLKEDLALKIVGIDWDVLKAEASSEIREIAETEALGKFLGFIYPNLKKQTELACQEFNLETDYSNKLFKNVFKQSNFQHVRHFDANNSHNYVDFSKKTMQALAKTAQVQSILSREDFLELETFNGIQFPEQGMLLSDYVQAYQTGPEDLLMQRRHAIANCKYLYYRLKMLDHIKQAKTAQELEEYKNQVQNRGFDNTLFWDWNMIQLKLMAEEYYC